MKKQIWIEILVIAALAAGWFYMEKTESLTTFVKENMTKEEIVAEMPEIAVTKQDEKLEDYVMGCRKCRNSCHNLTGEVSPMKKRKPFFRIFWQKAICLRDLVWWIMRCIWTSNRERKNGFPIPLTAQEPSLCRRSSGCMNSVGMDGAIQPLMKHGGIPM